MTHEPGLEEGLEPHLRARPVLVVLSGPSGVGKDAVVQGVTTQDSRLRFVATVTDRPRRPEEKDGVDYRFVTGDVFQEMVARGDLLEHAVVYGQNKGIPRAEVRDALSRGEDVLLRVDVQGARTVKSLISEAVTVFLAPPSKEALISRLSARKTEGGPELEKRI
ncbi:MAG: guanylate kinase, partial [Anaerolineae bacterium]